MMQTFRLIGEIVYFVISSAFLLNLWLQSRYENERWPFQKPLPPKRRVVEVVGACGTKGCKILKPHSHVVDLCKRIREK